MLGQRSFECCKWLQGCCWGQGDGNGTSVKDWVNHCYIQAIRERKGYVLTPHAYQDRVYFMHLHYICMLTSLHQGQNCSMGVRKSLSLQSCPGPWVSQPDENGMSRVLHTISFNSVSRCQMGVCLYSGSDCKAASSKSSTNWILCHAQIFWLHEPMGIRYANQEVAQRRWLLQMVQDTKGNIGEQWRMCYTLWESMRPLA